MTYNIHHGNPPSKAAEGTIDLRAIANVINKAKPDLVALQEVDVNTTRSGIDVNEAEALAKLTGMHFHFSQALNYQGGKYGDAVLSRFPIADTFSYQLPIIKGTNEEIRVLSMIKVKLPGNKVILFGSTHLGLSEDTRILQAKSLVKIVQSLKLPLVVGGDFNAFPESKPIQILDEVFTRSCTSDCGFTSSAQNPRHKIDYIMYRPKERFTVSSYEIIQETYASDHFPILVTLSFK
ncbi:MAG: endonuclease/exonuclease/phosphatase family protein [Acidobacterium ailaaui]|nr:endonuclease/exonuclease/phosphatase family protein [Pseudacidobacterium ailaaui]